jgi:hypothetical protein
MKIALIHDAITVYGGAEKVLEEFHSIFPSAPIYVPVYKQEAFPASFHQWDIQSSWINQIPGAAKFYRQLFFLYPYAMHDINLEQYDVVLSSSFNFAHNIVTGLDTCHISYCHSPPRFLWDFQHYMEHERLSYVRGLVAPLLPRLLQRRVEAGPLGARVGASRASTRSAGSAIVPLQPDRPRAFAAQGGRGRLRRAHHRRSGPSCAWLLSLALGVE